MAHRGVKWVVLGLLVGCGGVEDAGTGGAGAATGGAATGGGSASSVVSTSSGSGAGGAGAGPASSSSTAASSGSGGAPDGACATCVEVKDVFEDGTPCGDTLAACTAEPDCLAWLQCSNGCFDDPSAKACIAACTQAHPGAAPHVLALYQCVCAACSTECGVVCM